MSDEKNTSITVFETIRQNTDIATQEQLSVPLSLVFGHGTVGDVASFGDNTLLENTKKVDVALKNVGELQNIWNHSHSQWDWKHINLSYLSPYKNMRQIAGEIASKKTALNEAKWNHVKTEIEIKKLEEKLSDPKIEYWDEVDAKVEVTQKKEQLAEGMSYIEGAMKDILALNGMYEQLKSKVNEFSEADFEKEESKNHLKRSLVQCIRDVRQSGTITKGEQEYLEQVGVNPSKIIMLLQEYVKSEMESDSWDTTMLFDFVDKLVDELIDYHNVDVTRMKLMGFDNNPNDEYSYGNKVALLPDV